MREASIAAGFAWGLVKLAESKGANQLALAARAGISIEDLSNQDNRIPYAKYVALMRAGKELTGDAALALHFGEAYEVADLSIVGLIGEACETATEAFSQLDRYMQLAADIDVDHPEGKRLVIERVGETAWLIDTRRDPNSLSPFTIH